VRDAVKNGVEASGHTLHYDHPFVMLQPHDLLAEGYHHGQNELALKVAGSHGPMQDPAGHGGGRLMLRSEQS